MLLLFCPKKHYNLEQNKPTINNFNPNFNFSKNGLNNKRKKSKLGKILKILVILLVVVGILFFLQKNLNKRMSGKTTLQQASALPVTSQILPINKKFTFPGLDEAGKKKGKLDLNITTVEKTNQVIVQEKTYTAKNGKIFLIINLELKNESTSRLNIFPGDLIRLVVNGVEDKKLAPDLHNNYVNVAPLSTKIERVGFVIDSQAQGLKLQVGELEEDKEVIEVKF